MLVVVLVVVAAAAQFKPSIGKKKRFQKRIRIAPAFLFQKKEGPWGKGRMVGERPGQG